MLSRTLKTAVVALIAAGPLAGSAQATVVDTDDVKLTDTGYDFGGLVLAGRPTGYGRSTGTTRTAISDRICTASSTSTTRTARAGGSR